MPLETDLKSEYPEYVIDEKQYANYKNSELIYESDLSKVYKYKDEKTNEEFILKEVNLDKYFIGEVKTLIEADHKRLIKLIGFFETSLKGVMVLPYYEVGDLYKFCTNTDRIKDINPTQKTIIAAKIAEGIYYMHKKNLINRDIKPQNILLDKNYFPFLCDLGFVREDSDGPKSFCGTKHFAAPEVFDEIPIYDKKADVFSYGALLYCFSENKCLENYNNIKMEKKEKTINELIEKCLKKNPEERPTIEDIYEGFLNNKYFFKGTDPKEFDIECACDTLELDKNCTAEDVRNKAFDLTLKYSPLMYKGEDIPERMKYIKISAEKLMKHLKD